MAYEVYLRREILEFLRQCRSEERPLVMKAFQALGNDPFRKGDYVERDRTGRNIEVLVFKRFAIHYWADHAVKELKIVELRFADE